MYAELLIVIYVYELLVLFLYPNLYAYVFLLPTEATLALKVYFTYSPSSFAVPSELHLVTVAVDILGLL